MNWVTLRSHNFISGHLSDKAFDMASFMSQDCRKREGGNCPELRVSRLLSNSRYLLVLCPTMSFPKHPGAAEERKRPFPAIESYKISWEKAGRGEADGHKMKAKQSQGWKPQLLCFARWPGDLKKKLKSEDKNKSTQPKRRWGKFTTIEAKARCLPVASGRTQWLWISDQESQYLCLKLLWFSPSLRNHRTCPWWNNASQTIKPNSQIGHLQRHTGMGCLHSPALLSPGSNPSGTAISSND